MNSMTGFGRAEGTVGGSQIVIEVKSVNHRYLDSRLRLPGFLSALELTLAQNLRDRFKRGSFDCTIRHKLMAGQSAALTGTRFVIDERAASSLREACAWLHSQKITESAVPSLEFLAQTGRVFVPVEEISTLDEHQPAILSIFEKATTHLEKTRSNEGVRIQEMLTNEIQVLESITQKLSVVAKQQPAHIRTELDRRIAQWKLTHEVDSARLESEIAFLADRADFTEELDRMGSHVSEFKALLTSDEPVGRKLDFYTQELHRELNTMGAKTQLTEITRLVVLGKSCVEKLRQQVQNVE